MQAAWIVEDSDADVSESENEEEDGMVLDEGENALNSQVRMDEFELDDDQASLALVSDEETETHSMMMVGIPIISIEGLYVFIYGLVAF